MTLLKSSNRCCFQTGQGSVFRPDFVPTFPASDMSQYEASWRFILSFELVVLLNSVNRWHIESNWKKLIDSGSDVGFLKSGTAEMPSLTSSLDTIYLVDSRS